jgi:hypothetical protein
MEEDLISLASSSNSCCSLSDAAVVCDSVRFYSSGSVSGSGTSNSEYLLEGALKSISS